MCHVTGSGAYVLLNFSSSALSAHLAHGDVLPGAWYPDADGDGSGDDTAVPLVCPAVDYIENADDCDDGDGATGPGMEEIADGDDIDCDGEIDEGLACPCFEEADGCAELAGRTLVLQRGRRPVAGPTVGADVYQVTAEGNAPYCSVWSKTWLAAPDHAWADDEEGWEMALTDERYALCEGVLCDWIDEHGVPLTTW